MKERNAALCFHKRKEIVGEYAHFLCSEIPMEHCAVSIKTTNYFAPLYLNPIESHETIRRETAAEDLKVAYAKAMVANNWDKRRVLNDIETTINGLYPLETYPRWPNFDPFFLHEISEKSRLSFLPDGRGDLEQTFGPEDVFAYIYAVFHSPTYRTRYAELLKVDFPRVPLISIAELFRELCLKGQELVDLHLMRDKRLANQSFWGTSYPVAGKHDVTSVDYRPPGDLAPGKDEPLEVGRVYINKAQPRKGIAAEYFEGIVPEVWEFKIGGYQVLDHWLKERKKHKRCLTIEDIEHFQKVVAVLRETIRIMGEIDKVIEAHGGWPGAFQKG